MKQKLLKKQQYSYYYPPSYNKKVLESDKPPNRGGKEDSKPAPRKGFEIFVEYIEFLNTDLFWIFDTARDCIKEALEERKIGSKYKKILFEIETARTEKSILLTIIISIGASVAGAAIYDLLKHWANKKIPKSRQERLKSIRIREVERYDEISYDDSGNPVIRKGEINRAKEEIYLEVES